MRLCEVGCATMVGERPYLVISKAQQVLRDIDSAGVGGEAGDLVHHIALINVHDGVALAHNKCALKKSLYLQQQQQRSNLSTTWSFLVA